MSRPRPRLSGALRRAFGNGDVLDAPSAQLLTHKREKFNKLLQASPWAKVAAAVAKDHKNKSLLRDFKAVAGRLLGSEADESALEACCTFTFEALLLPADLDSRRDVTPTMESQLFSKIKSKFGSHVERKDFSLAVELVDRLTALYMQIKGNKDRSTLFKDGGEDSLPEFGIDTPFNYTTFDPLPSVSTSSASFFQAFASSPFVSSAAASSAASPMASTASTPVGGGSAPKSAVASSFSASWLRDQCAKQFDGAAMDDMTTAIFDLLASGKDDDALQNDLFELLGFERFDFIQSLLENRYNVVSASTSGDASEDRLSPKLQKSKKTGPTVRKGDTGFRSQPAIAGQVSILSESEKKLIKAMRKEEKKFARLDMDGEQEALSLDAARLRDERIAQLEAASSAPLFTVPRAQRQVERYPFVFDSALDTRVTSSMIGGGKVLLPPDTERITKKEYDEVRIPAAKPRPRGENERSVPITDMSEVAQVAFAGVKCLNRIQSIVFNTAYKTNENMLVCAPTGAGKTNVAMLTILRTIEQHIEKGVIQKDQFKIVYVAPMKALAAEMTENFGRRLAPLGVTVKELTGDMQLTKAEIMATNMLITTPEKWDVVTRKSTGDVALAQIVKLLIIDEVHLLHDDRGPVIESIVARTLRQVESTQTLIRIVGLSATLPNYVDVAMFLRVNPYVGLFHFDAGFRPVPLATTFIGVKSRNKFEEMDVMNEVCFEKVIEQVRRGEQVMVFVHARNATVNTALKLRDIAIREHCMSFFDCSQMKNYGNALKAMDASRNKQLKMMFPDGFGIHHAGMLRHDRNLVEKYFSEGLIRVLVCTATLAWGVNLPAHAVIIKGTELYNAEKGTFVDLGILDVQQIFGRAGRPQFDTYGEACIITSHDKLSHYLTRIRDQLPIESQFIEKMTDNLNAEIVLGTVTNVDEAIRWLSYTYLYVRMRKNPMVYGISHAEKELDPDLFQKRRELVAAAARKLDETRMIRFQEASEYLDATDLGRCASHFYVRHDSIDVFNEYFRPNMTEADIFAMVSKSMEFEQIKVRDDELEELDMLLDMACHLHPVKGGSENTYGKVNILLQSYISRASVTSFSLVSDMAYVAQNAARIIRALFEIAVRKNMASLSAKLLTLCKCIDKQQWAFESPLRQNIGFLKPEMLAKIEEKKLTLDKMRDMTSDEVGHMLRHPNMGSKVKQVVEQFPHVELEATIQPITRTVLRVTLKIIPAFTWVPKIHGKAESWWIWVEDPSNEHLYHTELFQLIAEKCRSRDESERVHTLAFTIPIFEPLPPQYYIRAISDTWLGAEAVIPVSFQHLILPQQHAPHTELLDLQPLPKGALKDPRLEALYSFTHFNPVQTQIFHSLYHTDVNVLLGAPTGSGKTVAAELALFRIFREYPDKKAVYIAPLKALVRERVDDWKQRIEGKLGYKVVELTGDTTPDIRAIETAKVIVTTPEKWDGISRSWQNRSYVKSVALLIIDEIHLLGGDRGPVLEVIVSRSNYISAHTTDPVRIVGLSTALANAHDLANWLGIDKRGLFNFKPSVRPVPLTKHIRGFPGKHYCPRMATMNKPAFAAINTHSPTKPALVFVASRRQTRLTALDFMALLANLENPKRWLHIPEENMDAIIDGVQDANLKLTLSFGIGLHHAGLHEKDRKLVEELFYNQRIQVLIATATLAWGVNLPAHLVIVKGTEFFDGKTKRYVDFDITDILQMTGRAGRPQFDDEAVAVVFVHDQKKHFYKKFMYEPFPVESSLAEVLSDHFNAEIVAGTITSKQDAMDYLTWTYFYRRLVMNPSFYGLEEVNEDNVNKFLSDLVERALRDLEDSGCIAVNEEDMSVEALTFGRIASYYYLEHATMRHFGDTLEDNMDIASVLEVLANANEFDEHPVRHNEDLLNAELAKSCPFPACSSMDSPHTKVHLLLQAHFSHIPLPIADYRTDTKSVLDNCVRILQAMVDVAADQGMLATCLQVMHLTQMVVQGQWFSDSSLFTLPNIGQAQVEALAKLGRHAIDCLPEFMDLASTKPDVLRNALAGPLTARQINEALEVAARLPIVEVSTSLRGVSAEGEVLRADDEYGLQVNLRCLNARSGHQQQYAHAPNFPKPIDESWWLVLGDAEGGELLALKRLGPLHRATSTTLAFFTPENPGKYKLTLYLMSSVYLGLDQQYDIEIEVGERAGDAAEELEEFEEYEAL